MKALYAVLSALLLVLPSFGAALNSPDRTITVSGSSQVKVAPDELELVLAVETLDPALDVAKSANDERMKKVIAALKAQGIEPRLVQTDAIHIEPHYWSESGKPVPPRLTHFTVQRNVVVILRNVAKFDATLEAVLNAGANRVLNISFRNQQLRKHRDRARSMAIRAAREKAEALAGELGMKIGKPVTIHENAIYASSGYHNYYGGYVRRFDYRGQMQNSVAEAPAPNDNAEAEDGTFSPGQIKIEASVTVVFELR